MKNLRRFESLNPLPCFFHSPVIAFLSPTPTLFFKSPLLCFTFHAGEKALWRHCEGLVKWFAGNLMLLYASLSRCFWTWDHNSRNHGGFPPTCLFIMEQLTSSFLVSSASLSLETYVSRHPMSSYLEKKKRGGGGEHKKIKDTYVSF